MDAFVCRVSRVPLLSGGPFRVQRAGLDGGGSGQVAGCPRRFGGWVLLRSWNSLCSDYIKKEKIPDALET